MRNVRQLENIVARAFARDGWLVREGFRYLAQQEEYALVVCRWLTASADKPAGLIEASTGIGKSLGYLIPAFCWAALTGERIAISTFTIQLQRQLLSGDVEIAQRYLQFSGFEPLAIGHFLGRANYLNGRRIKHLQHSINSSAAKNVLSQLLQWCSGEDGTLQGYVEIHGELPDELAAHDICLHVNDDDDDAPVFIAQRAAVQQADIIVTSHAVMILNSAMSARAAPIAVSDILPKLNAVIFDEADRLEAAAGFLQKRVTLSHLRSLIEALVRTHAHAANATSQSLKLLFALLKAVTNFDLHLQQLDAADSRRPLMVAQFAPPTRALAVKLAASLQRTLEHWRAGLFKHDDVGVIDELSAIGAWLERFTAPHGEANQYCGVIWSPVQHLPSLYEFRIDPQSIVTRDMRSLRDDETVVRKLFTSATLSDANASHALRFKGFWSALRVKSTAVCCEASFEPKYFGDMQFVLAMPAAPEPFVGGETDFMLAEAWLDYCVRMLTHVAQLGPALVLTNSYDETEQLSARLAVSHIAHRRGIKLNAVIAEFRARRTLLITPAAWEGVSLRQENGAQLFRELVITRVPFARTSEEELAALRVLARNRSGGLSPESIAFTRRANEAKRKLHQGMGRGIRSVFDTCRVWIADPRFPHPDKTAGFTSLRSAIPERFWQRYENAVFFSAAGTLEPCRNNLPSDPGDIAMQYL